MNTFNKTLQMLLIAGSLFALTACEQNTAEEAGDAVEEMVDDAGDAAEEAGDAMDDAMSDAGDKAEEAGDAMDDAMTDAGNAVEDACEKVKEGVKAEDTDC